MMPFLTQPLREEHAQLRPHIDQLRDAADRVGGVPEDTTRDVEMAYTFLVHHLIPHARAEEAVLYPTVGMVMGAADATATMRRDHVEVARLTDELGDLRARLAAGEDGAALTRDLRRVLYGLYTLVGVHFAKEEEVYLPLLDARLTQEEARRMFHDMEHAAAAVRAHAHAA